jgi:hypothetical protein
MKSSQSSHVRRSAQAGYLLGLLVCASGCRWHEGGLAGGGGVAVDPLPPTASPGAPATDAAPPPPKPVTPPATDAAPPATDAGRTDAGLPTPPPSAPPPASDAGPPVTPPPAMDAGPAVDLPPAPPPPAVDSCAPGNTLLPTSLRQRLGRAEDFTFDNQGRMLVIESRDIVQIGDNERDLIIVRNVGALQGGTLRVLPDGDILLADLGRNQLLRIDPNGRRPDRSDMSVSAPLKMAPAPGLPTSFYVSSQMGVIYLADTTTGGVRNMAMLDFKAGGLAVDQARRKLYVGAMGKSQVVSFTIGAQGELEGRAVVAEAVPQPTSLVVDSCGGVFIGGGDGGAIRRIGLAGATTVVARINDARDITTLEFGSGKNGWSETSLFALDTYWGELHEIRLKR